MKTQYETRYEKLIISTIIHKETLRMFQASSLYEFHQNSRKYYDSLCASLYLISVGRTDHSLWLTHAGEAKLVCPHEAGEGLAVFEASEIPVFKDDLIEQLEYVFNRLEAILGEK